MSLPYRPITYPHKTIGVVSLQEPTVVIDIYKVLFDRKYYEEPVPILKDTLDITITNIGDMTTDDWEYIKSHLYINGCPFNNQQENGPHCTMEIDFSKNRNYFLILKFNDIVEGKIFNFHIQFTHKTKKETDTFVLYHISETLDTGYIAEHGVNISGLNASYMLLRTNPKLTGNIKLVCTNDDKMYLDTFKAHTDKMLSQRAYRKKLVGNDGEYPIDVYNVFRHVPAHILMDVSEDLINGQNNTIFTDFKDQYITDYEYGVSENTDNLYDESLKILAPLYLGEQVPDYFIIFRCNITDIPNPKKPGYTQNAEQKDVDDWAENVNLELAEQLTGCLPKSYQSYIQTGEIFKMMEAVKIFDLRSSTQIGSYLHKYREKADKYINRAALAVFSAGWIQIGCIRKQGYRLQLRGINYSTGTMYTTTRNIMLGDSDAVFDNNVTNAFMEAGFLHPNILNLEFMFDDPNAAMLKSYNYFGLYLTENQMYSISHVINNKENIFNVVDIDGKQMNLLTELEPIFNNEESETRIFSASTDTDIAVVKTIDNIASFAKGNVTNHPGKMIGTPEYKPVTYIPMKAFLTIKFDHIIKAGEHFKIIKPIGTADVSRKCQVLELIASSDSRLLRYKNRHGHYINTNNIKGIEIYQIPFYVSEDDTLESQIANIASCIKLFDSFVWVSGYTSSTIAISTQETSLVFQHIMYPACEDEYDYIHYYNCEHDTKLTDNHVAGIDEVTGKVAAWYSYNPVYNISGKRISSLVNFMKTDSLTGFYIYEITGEFDTYLNGTMQPLYFSDTHTYEPLGHLNMVENGDIKTGADILKNPDASEYTVYTIVSPTDASKHYIFTQKPICPGARCCNLYESKSFDINVLGITPVKDICTMFDTSATLQTTSRTIISIPAGEQLNPGKFGIRLFKCYKLLSGSLPYCEIGGTIMFISYAMLLIKSNNNVPVIQHHSNKFVPYRTLTTVVLEDLCQYGTGEHDYMYDLEWPGSRVYDGCSYTVVPNTLCGWEGVDSVFDGIRKITHMNHSTLSPAANYGFLNYPNLTKTQGDSKHQFVPYSLFDYIHDENGNTVMLRDLILSGAPNTLNYYYKQYLVPSSALYSSSPEYLRFNANGLLYSFSLSSLTTTYDIALNFSTLDGYEAMVIFDYKENVHNELFISTEEKTILFAVHSLYIDKSTERCNNIINVAESGEKSGLSMSDYYWVNSKYSYDFINTLYMFKAPTFKHMNILAAGQNPIDSQNTLLYAYTQVGYPIYHNIADFNEPGYMVSMSAGQRYKYAFKGLHLMKAGNNFDKYANIDKMILSYDMALKHTDRHEDENGNIVEDTWTEDSYIRCKPVEPTGLFQFFKQASQYDSVTHTGYVNVVDDGILAYDIIPKQDNREYESFCMMMQTPLADIQKNDSILQPKVPELVKQQPFTIHIIKGRDETVTLDIDPETYDGITVSCSEMPNKRKYAYTFIEPEKRNMFVFEPGDKLLTSLLHKDYTGANTHLRTTMPIIGYTYNRVYENYETGNSLDDKDLQVILKSRDIFANPWTMMSKVYLSKGNNKAKMMQMANCGYNIKCFFGSCAMTYPDQIKITSLDFNRKDAIALVPKWGGANMQVGKKYSLNVTIDYNLVFTNYMSAYKDFTDNWMLPGETIGSERVTTAINNYIKNTLLPKYNIKDAPRYVRFFAGYTRRSSTIGTIKKTPVLCKTKDELKRKYPIIDELVPYSGNNTVTKGGHNITLYELDLCEGIYIEFTFNKY